MRPVREPEGMAAALAAVPLVAAKGDTFRLDTDIGSILGYILVGLIVGLLARVLVPGRDPVGLLGTLVIGVVGAVLGGWLGDKYNIKHVLVAFYAMGAVSLTVMGYTKSTELLFLIVFVVGASTLGTQLLAYAYAGGFYPTAIRSTGVGFASGIGRTGAILAPILIGVLVSLELPLEQNFMAIGLAGLLGTIAVMLINHRLCASTHHYDATKEAEQVHAASVKTGKLTKDQPVDA